MKLYTFITQNISQTLRFQFLTNPYIHKPVFMPVEGFTSTWCQKNIMSMNKLNSENRKKGKKVLLLHKLRATILVWKLKGIFTTAKLDINH